MSSDDTEKKQATVGPLEISQIKIVEKLYEVEVPKYVERVVEVPKYTEVKYEKPVIYEKTYEKPVINIKDITKELKDMVMDEVAKGISEAIQTLKVSFEVPMSRILQVQPGGKIKSIKEEKVNG